MGSHLLIRQVEGLQKQRRSSQETIVQPLKQGPGSSMEKAMAPHSSTLAWKIPWTEDPGRLQSMGSWRVGHDWATSLSLFTFMHWRRKWHPLQCSHLENPRDGGAWWAAIYGVAQSWTRLKRLSSMVSGVMICSLPLVSLHLSCLEYIMSPKSMDL